MDAENPVLLDGWYSVDGDAPHLIGSRCQACGSYYFPKQSLYCRNPACDSSEFEEVPLSRSGTVWSYTNACYQPPPPYVAAESYAPFAIAAVELAAEKMIVLGQVVRGVDVTELAVGQQVEVAIEPLDDGRLVWKWKPCA